MTVTELLPTLKQLNRYEKIRVVQILIDDIAREEAAFFESGKQYEVWSPYESYEAAAILHKMLEERKQNV